MKYAEAISRPTVAGASRKRRGRRRFRRGVALVWSALVLTVMMLMMGLSLDWGKTAWNVHQLQNAADAAALAGAQIVKGEPAGVTIQRAATFALMNSAEQLPVTLRTAVLQAEPFGGDEAPFDVILGRWVKYNRTFFPTLDAPNAVKAIARRTAALGGSAPALKLVFGRMAGVETVDASVPAVAWCSDSGGAGLICLSDSAVPGLYISGNAYVDVDRGGIHVNSTAVSDNPSGQFDGANVSGGAWVDAGFINVVGEISPAPLSDEWAGINGIGDDGTAAITVTEDVDRIEDPLAAAMVGNTLVDYDHLKLPDLIKDGTILTRTQTADGTLLTDITDPDTGSIIASCTLEPGYYPNGLRFENGVTITLDPGVVTSGAGTLFVFGGAGMVVKGALVGHGVTCYVTHIPSDADPDVVGSDVLGVTDWGATAMIDLWSPGDWTNDQHEPDDCELVQGLNGIAVWQDPTMVDANGDTPDVHLNGTPEGGVHGTLYFPDPIHVLLNGDLGQMGNQILCGSADILGRATFSVDYDGRNTPDPSNSAVLVYFE